MDYTSYPTTSSILPPQDTSNNKVSAKNFYGSAPLGGSTGINFAGSGGINGTQGIWLGSSQFSTAPFSVDLSGNLVANTLKITGFINTGGAASDVNSGATTILGSQITAGTITASKMTAGTITAASGIINDINANVITAGTLNAGVVSVTNLTATNINTGTLNGSIVGVTNLNGSSATTFSANTIDGASINLTNLNASYITAGTIGAARISVANLSAISANMGTITAGTITGGTITGGTVQTAASGSRVALVGTGSRLEIYDGSALVGTLSAPGTNIIQLRGSNASVSVDVITSTGLGLHIGPSAAAIDMDTTVIGSFTVTGTKHFDIEHPTKKGMRLKYTCIEADEVLVMCRGISDTEEDIVYPQHFIDVSEKGSIQCQIGKLKGSSLISWFATGVRKGYADFEPEYKGDSVSDYVDTFKPYPLP